MLDVVARTAEVAKRNESTTKSLDPCDQSRSEKSNSK